MTLASGPLDEMTHLPCTFGGEWTLLGEDRGSLAVPWKSSESCIGRRQPGTGEDKRKEDQGQE